MNTAISQESKNAGARGSAAYVVEYPSFDRETHNFCWKELVRYPTRKLAEKVVKMNRRRAELRFRKLEPKAGRRVP